MSKREDKNTISNAEWEVMRVLWAHDQCSSKEVIQVLTPKMDWKPATIKTLLGRLVDKGYVQVDKEHSPYLYSPKLTEKEAEDSELDHLLNNTCKTKADQLIVDMINKSDLDPPMVQHIQDALNQKDTVPKVYCQCPKGQCNCQKH